jgi:hypothetical protein
MLLLSTPNNRKTQEWIVRNQPSFWSRSVSTPVITDARLAASAHAALLNDENPI